MRDDLSEQRTTVPSTHQRQSKLSFVNHERTCVREAGYRVGPGCLITRSLRVPRHFGSRDPSFDLPQEFKGWSRYSTDCIMVVASSASEDIVILLIGGFREGIEPLGV
jgi:hypothetical protein